MRRPLAALILAALPLAAPAMAATNYIVSCEGGGFEQKVREGTTMRELTLGMGSVPFWCPSTRSIQNYRIGLEGEALETLRRIAAMEPGDDELVVRHVAWLDDDTPEGEAVRTAIGFGRDGTFGRLRQTLAGLAKPTGEWVADTGFRSYNAPGCGEPLIPLRYYWVTGAPFPGCDGRKLVKGKDEAATWE